MHIYYFEKLDVWREARDLAVFVYNLSSKLPHSERYSLMDQIRRAALSISSNIAEGSTRNSPYGSAIEVLNHTLLAREFGYIDDDDALSVRQRVNKITNQLQALNKIVQSTKQRHENTIQQ